MVLDDQKDSNDLPGNAASLPPADRSVAHLARVGVDGCCGLKHTSAVKLHALKRLIMQGDESPLEDTITEQSGRQPVERLATHDTKGRPLLLTVACVGAGNASFVLVNRGGTRTGNTNLVIPACYAGAAAWRGWASSTRS